MLTAPAAIPRRGPLIGVGAIPAGAWLDCCGARALMTAGSLFAAGCVQLWAQAGSVLACCLTCAFASCLERGIPLCLFPYVVAGCRAAVC